MKFPKLEQLNTPSGRYYRTPDGVFPSVTTVLGSIPNPGITAWRAAVGDEEADKVSKRATDRGTRIHKYAEDYFNDLEIQYASIFDKVLFKSLFPILADIDNVVMQEQRLYSRVLKSAGTVDLIADYKGTLSVIDWKTSNNPKHEIDIENYFIQSSVYAIMYYELTGIWINQCVIVIAVEADQPQVFIQNIKPWVLKYKEIRKHFTSTM